VGVIHPGDASRGKALFIKDCASCHTLADANAQGTIGPNLDDAFSSDKQQGFALSTILNVVRGQISIPDPPMPANIVDGVDAQDVSTYVAQCSGNPHCGVTAASLTPPATTTTGTTTTTGSTTTTAGSGGSETAAGKTVFTNNCGTCHTLKDAGTTGTVGPDLDQLKPTKDIVEHQVTVGGGVMPAFKGRLTDAQIQAVAAYVSSVAGK
jgi:mono/diheme cytochrome c family protein